MVPGLFIGNQISAMEPRKLELAGIRQVLKVNGIPSNFPYDTKRVTEKVMSFDDSPEFTLGAKELAECFAFIEEAPTLVVCTAGRSRSAAVCISFLMLRRGLTFS